jgi:hypothetical protein
LEKTAPGVRKWETTNYLLPLLGLGTGMMTKLINKMDGKRER